MAKARIYGQKTTYIPNNRMDMRFIKKLSRNRECEVAFTQSNRVKKGGANNADGAGV